jgi:transposase
MSSTAAASVIDRALREAPGRHCESCQSAMTLTATDVIHARRSYSRLSVSRTRSACSTQARLWMLVPPSYRSRAKTAGACVGRWRIKRLFAWLHNFRRLVTRWERHVENFVAMLHLACARILLRHL